jgi:hypothetical protein
MNCSDELVDISVMDDRAAGRQLAVERNEALASRSEWIQAAFNLKGGNSVMFDKLASEELCPTCVTNFTNQCPSE